GRSRRSMQAAATCSRRSAPRRMPIASWRARPQGAARLSSRHAASSPRRRRSSTTPRSTGSSWRRLKSVTASAASRCAPSCPKSSRKRRAAARRCTTAARLPSASRRKSRRCATSSSPVGAGGAGGGGAASALREVGEAGLQIEAKRAPLRERLGELRLKEQAAQINFDQFAAQLREANADEEQLSREAEGAPRPAALQGEITRLAQAINELGAVNLAALEELRGSQERKSFLESQAAALEGAVHTLAGASRRIERA